MSARLEPMTSLADCRRAVLDRLANVRRRLRTQLLVEGIAWAVGAAVLLSVLSLTIDRLLRPDLSVRIALLVIGAVFLAVIAIRRLRNPLFLKLDDLDLAELLERRQRGIGQRLTTVIQLPQLLNDDPSASPSMIKAAVQEDFVALQQVDLQASFNSERRRNVLLVLAGLIALVCVFCVTNPAMAGLWARRWFGGANVRWPQETYLAVTGLGDSNKLSVPRGESVMLQVNAAAEFVQSGRGWVLSGRGEPLMVEGSERPTSAQPDHILLKLTMADGSQRLGNFTKFAPGQYRYELPPIAKEASFTISGGDDWFGPILIEPIDRPDVESITIIAHTPGKSEPEIIRAQDAEQQLLFLPTTRLELELTSTQDLSSAKVAMSGSDTVTELQRIDDRKYRFEWETKEAVTFEFQLASKSGSLGSKPHFLTIGILNDRPPRLTLRSSGVGRRVTPVAQIPLHLRVMDDFGVAKLAIDLEEVRIVDQKPSVTNHKPVEETFVESHSKGTSAEPIDQIISLWKPGMGHDPNGKPSLGFSGHVMFLSSGRSPMKVDRDIRIELFDDKGTKEESTKPLHTFDYSAGAWNIHVSETSIGPVYSVFIHYPRDKVTEANCRLRVGLKRESKPTAFSESVNVLLTAETSSVANDGTIPDAQNKEVLDALRTIIESLKGTATVSTVSKLLTDVEREPIIALSQYNLVPGCSVRIRGTAADACVLGTQSADSRWLSFQVVSSDELFYEILTRQREQRAKLAKALEAAKGQLDSLRKMNTSAEASAVVRVHQAIARQVWQIAGMLNGTLQEMTLNDLGNPTARQLLDKGIIKPLYELHGGSFNELRGKLEALATSQIIDEERRETATVAQTQAVEQIQRIMDQMSQWESFVDVVNQLRHVISSQEQIRESTEKTQKEQIKGVFDDE